MAGKTFHLTYSCASDEYIRQSDNNKKTSGYQVMVNKAENLFRKMEHDWKMAYLAREEGTDKAEIVWKFDFTGRNYKGKPAV